MSPLFFLRGKEFMNIFGPNYVKHRFYLSIKSETIFSKQKEYK